MKADIVNHVGFDPHDRAGEWLRQGLKQFNPAMIAHARIWFERAQRRHREEAVSALQSWRDYDHRSRLHHFRFLEAVEVANQNGPRFGVKFKHGLR